MNYTIKYINGEKILYILLDNNYDFGIDFNLKHKYSSMKKRIKKYMKKINFDGEKVALSIGGIVLAVFLVIENPDVSDKLDLVYVNDSVIPSSKVVLAKEEKIVEEISEQNNDVVEAQALEPKEKKETIKKEEVPVVETKQEIKEEVKEVALEEIKDTNTYVKVYRSNGDVLDLELEEYLIGVVGAEMPASFNIEALKVQAIISRTYALKSIENGRKLTDTVSTQVYKDNSELKNQWGNEYEKYYTKVKQAVDDTKGISIYYNGKHIDALFFASSNGKTEDAEYVWGNSIPYLKSVDSSWDKNTTSYYREISLDLTNVFNVLGVSNSDFNIISKDSSGRVLEIVFGGKNFSGVEFRNLLKLRSADFDIEVVDDKLKITTYGYGHGVGVSQYGANEMAKNGYNCFDIIRHYYTDVDIY